MVPLETDLCALAHEFMCRDKLFRGIVEIGDRCVCVCACVRACVRARMCVCVCVSRYQVIITGGVVLAYIHVFVHG